MGNVVTNKEPMTTIQVTRSIAAQLQSLGKWGDTYSTIIRRLLDGRKGDPHEDRGEKTDESTGASHHQRG